MNLKTCTYCGDISHEASEPSAICIAYLKNEIKNRDAALVRMFTKAQQQTDQLLNIGRTSNKAMSDHKATLKAFNISI